MAFIPPGLKMFVASSIGQNELMSTKQYLHAAGQFLAMYSVLAMTSTTSLGDGPLSSSFSII
ncbi:hypothetical protein ACHAXH_002223 [Discostella pseudostelligera]